MILAERTLFVEAEVAFNRIGKLEKMADSTIMSFTKKPNILLTWFWAVLGRSKRVNPEDSMPRISASWKGATIDESRLLSFNRICEISSDSISAIFPLSFVYPVVQRILASRAAPLSIFQVLNSRIQMTQHRSLEMDKEFDIFSNTKGYRIRPKGLELDIVSVIKSGDITYLETNHTFYYRGTFGTPDASYVPPRFSPVVDEDTVQKWFLPGGVGLRFARILGDWNGLHYSKSYARLLGYKRDFVQPLLVIARVVDHFVSLNSKACVKLDVLFKGPLYYNSEVAMKSNSLDNSSLDNGTRFDVYSAENHRPSISGIIYK